MQKNLKYGCITIFLFNLFILRKSSVDSVVKRKWVRPDAVMIMTSVKLGECGELQAYFDGRPLHLLRSRGDEGT